MSAPVHVSTTATLAANETTPVRQMDKPWLRQNMSRATWYRHGKTALTKPPKLADQAKKARLSLRTLQRGRARLKLLQRFAPDLCSFDAIAKHRPSQLVEIVHYRIVLAMDLIPSILAQFERERRNDTSAEAIAAHIGDPIYNVEIVKEALAHLGKQT